MNGNYSFSEVLKYYLSLKKPQKILEWGPGYSTQVMIDTVPSAQIITIEHDNSWLKKAQIKYGNTKNVKIIHQKLDCICSKYATTAYQYAPFDLIFIDGRRRVECCFVAFDVISPDGVILLHDCDRKSYRRIIDKYIDIIEEKDRTLVFKKKLC